MSFNLPVVTTVAMELVVTLIDTLLVPSSPDGTEGVGDGAVGAGPQRNEICTKTDIMHDHLI